MRFQSLASRAIPAVGLLALAGCATVTRGTTNQIQFTSEPSNAFMRTSMGQTCNTPCTLTVGRKDEFTATFQLNGYEEQSVFIKTQVAGGGAAGMAGNLLVGGIVGMGADVATGATLEHVPNPVHAVLRRLGASQSTAPGAPRRG